MNTFKVRRMKTAHVARLGTLARSRKERKQWPPRDTVMKWNFGLIMGRRCSEAHQPPSGPYHHHHHHHQQSRHKKSLIPHHVPLQTFVGLSPWLLRRVACGLVVRGSQGVHRVPRLNSTVWPLHCSWRTFQRGLQRVCGHFHHFCNSFSKGADNFSDPISLPCMLAMGF